MGYFGECKVRAPSLADIAIDVPDFVLMCGTS